MSFLIASMSLSELKNDTSNQSELNETKNNEHNQIFEVLDKLKIRGCEPLSGFKSLCKNVCMKLVVFDTIFNNE